MLDAYWYIACKSKNLKNKPLGLKVLNKSLVLYRGSDDIVYAMQDRCLHRNAPLSAGKICKNTLQCPYHGWSFNGDGSIADIPVSPHGESSQGLNSRSIPSYQCIEQDGYVWVLLAPNDKLESPPSFPWIHDSSWTTFHMQNDFSAPVDACLENFLDCPHATFVHNRWFRSSSKEITRAVTRTLDDGAETEYFEEPREKSLVWKLLSSAKTKLKHTDRFIAPAMSRVDYDFSDGRYYVISSACTPIDEETTRVFTVISFKTGNFKPWINRIFGKIVQLIFQPLSHIIIKQDVRMLKLQYDNIRQFNGPAFSVIKQDVLFMHIKQWRSAIEKQEAPPTAGQEVDVELCI